MAESKLTVEQAKALYEQARNDAARTLAAHLQRCRVSIDAFERRTDKEMSAPNDVFGPEVE